MVKIITGICILSFHILQTTAYQEFVPGYEDFFDGSSDIEIYLEREMRQAKSWIAYVTCNGRYFVIKQMKEESIVGCVKEVLGSYIAESLHLPINKVRIIKPNQKILGKKFSEKSATMHSLVPGVPITQSEGYKDLSVQLRWKPHIPKDKHGLTLKVVEAMTKHPDLPRIIALDTFIGNGSRCRKNLFYDVHTNKFWGIDLEASFDKDLCKHTIERIKEWKSKKICLSKRQVNAMLVYRETLSALIHNNPVKVTCIVLERLLKAAVCVDKSLAVQMNEYHKHYISMLHKSFESACELITIIDDFLIISLGTRRRAK